jgi:hypothetical protein
MEIQILSLIIAILAVIIGPFITYRITKKNLEFQFRTMTQEKWIDKLETKVGNYLNITIKWIEKYPDLIERGQKEPVQIKEINQEIDLMLDTINASVIKLDLILDSKSPHQKLIIDNVIKMKVIVNNKVFDKDSINELRKSHAIIIENAKAIFQEERSKIAKIFR